MPTDAAATPTFAPDLTACTARLDPESPSRLEINFSRPLTEIEFIEISSYLTHSAQGWRPPAEHLGKMEKQPDGFWVTKDSAPVLDAGRPFDAADMQCFIRAAAIQLRELCLQINDFVEAQYAAAYGHDASDSDADEILRLEAAEPRRWLAWGRDGMQLCLMQLERAVAQPSTF